VLFDSGILSESKLPLLKELKAPVSFFLGGPKDIAYAQVSCSYSSSIVARSPLLMRC